MNHNASKKTDRKTASHLLKNVVKPKPQRPARRAEFRSSPWYEKAAQSIAVSARVS
ncbi:MAG TPA: hypothetical protein VH678_00295 [Xanthobacteraceae bacterium]